MERKTTFKRPDWLQRITNLGLTYNFISPDGKTVDTTEPYWMEDVYYQFSPSAIESIKRATFEIHNVCKSYLYQSF